MKYSISEIVRIKSTGEKVSINSRHNFEYGAVNANGRWGAYNESELKPYRPSRTGKYRNARGQFTYKEKCICSWCDKEFPDIGKHLMECYMRKAAQEQRQHFSYEEPDSKQRNYQKIITKLDIIEKKIDELGRRV